MSYNDDENVERPPIKFPENEFLMERSSLRTFLDLVLNESERLKLIVGGRTPGRDLQNCALDLKHIRESLENCEQIMKTQGDNFNPRQYRFAALLREQMTKIEHVNEFLTETTINRKLTSESLSELQTRTSRLKEIANTYTRRVEEQEARPVRPARTAPSEEG